MPGVIYELDGERVVAASTRSAPFWAVDATRSPDAVVSLMTAVRPITRASRARWVRSAGAGQQRLHVCGRQGGGEAGGSHAGPAR